MLRVLVTLLAAVAIPVVITGNALAAPSGQSGAADVAAATAPAATARASSLELGIVRELNRVRAERGLQPVRLSTGLVQAAVGHSAAMLRSGVFDHTSVDGTTFDRRVLRSYPVKGFSAWRVGENLLFDSGPLDAPAAVEAWMNSPSHRDNMLDPAFREVGVGALEAPSAPGQFGGGHVIVVTLDFGVRTPAKPVRTVAGT